MNASDLWPAIARIEAAYSLQLTQALIHFLWQGCAIAALYAAAMFALRRSTAAARHLAGAAALLLMAACLPITLCLLPSQQSDETRLAQTDEGRFDAFLPLGTSGEEPAAEDDFLGTRSEMGAAAGLSSSAFPGNMPRTAGQASSGTQAILSWLSPYASAVYLLGVVLMLGRVSLGVWGVGRLRRICTPVADNAMLQLIRDCARRMALRAVPVVAYCRRISTPMAVGILRPMILLPAALASGLTPTQLQAILLHEMAHLRRYDLIVNILQRLVEAMLFFHPAVWWISRRVSIERENACDELATLAGEERVQYADALLRAAELCAMARSIDTRRAASLAATGENASQFGDRLRRLLGQNDRPKFRLTIAGAAASVLLVVALLLMPTILRGAGGACDKVADEKPVSMSADEFMQLTPTEQRDLLVSVFQRRLEHSNNLFYETEQVWEGRKNRDGHPDDPWNDNPSPRWRFRHWRLGDSFRQDTDDYRTADDAEPWTLRSCGVNGEEGIGRNTNIYSDGQRPSTGQVQYPYNLSGANRYIDWFDRNFPECHTTRLGEYMFPFLIRHKNEYEIEKDNELIRLSVPWQPSWANKPGGKRVYLLDPQKGFLPVKCDARWDGEPLGGKPSWRVESFLLEESRAVGDVWMPMKLAMRTEASSVPDLIALYKIKVLRMEHGAVKPSDLMIPFDEGMQIQDTVEGVIYTADVEGNPVEPVENAPNWKHNPPDWWIKHYGKVPPGAGGYSLASKISEADRKRLADENEQFEREKNLRREALEKHFNKLKSLPSEAVDERIDAAMEILRTYRVGENVMLWAGTIRELILMGKPTVPRLSNELDRCKGDKTMRALGFVLRGIGDPRAIPALIRAIPRSFESHGDGALPIKDDPELLQFMLKNDNNHDNDNNVGAIWFSFGSPTREIMTALKKLAEPSPGWWEFRFVNLKGGKEQRRVIQTQSLALARRWADWWKNEWRKYLDDEPEAQLDLLDKSLHEYANSIPKAASTINHHEFPRGQNVVMDGGVHDDNFRTFDRSPSNGFRDLDSGRRPSPPKNLVEESTGGVPSKNLLAWAKREGVDLIAVEHTQPDGKKPYIAFIPLGMKVWRIDSDRYDGILEELRADGKLDLPEPWESFIAQTDPKTGAFIADQPAVYLFITAEGVCGVIRLEGGGVYDGGILYSFFYKRDEGTK
ncbi:MAG: M56 family metallopeptidase [Pirellulaceae bacterium]|nr:M56 family metallopeptidase [Pirellulaceae bacterium]